MEFPDLYEFPKNSPPSPYGDPVLVVKVGYGVLPEGSTLRAIGWLEKRGFKTGKVAKQCIAALVESLQRGIFNDGYRGFHSCALCGKFQPEFKWKRRRIVAPGHGHYLVQHRQIVYMAPGMLLHYIIDHDYCPPIEFLEAAMNGRFLSEEDLIIDWRAKNKEIT